MKRLFLSVVFLALLLASADAEAQCAMCKAVAESSTNAGGGIAQGLNDGILYLMSIPYLLIGTVGFFWYRHKKNQG